MSDRVYPCDYCKLLKSPCHEKNGGPGLVYCMSNPWYHDSEGNPLYKIGLSNDIIIRKKDLSAPAGVPTPFVLVFAKRVPCMYYFEAKLHKYFQSSRINKSREFFTADIEKIRSMFDIWLPGDFITSIEDCIKVPRETSDEAVLEDSSCEASCDEPSKEDDIWSFLTEYCTRDPKLSNDDDDLYSRNLELSGKNRVYVRIKKYPEYRVIFDLTTKEIFDLEEKNTDFKTLSSFARFYYEKNMNIKKLGTSYESCEYMDREGNWKGCRKDIRFRVKA
jgi:hypothetical protein